MKKNKIESVILSIIIPIYNMELYLEECLESLINEVTDKFEIILVNDGSMDRSLEICNQYINKYNNIQLVNQENRGLSAARNMGLSKASGEYITFIDPDDWVKNNYIKTIIKEVKSKHDVYVFGYCNCNKNLKKNILHSIPSNTYEGEKVKNAVVYLDENGYMLNFAWNKIYKKSLLIDNKIKFLNGTSYIEDILFNSIVFNYAKSVRFLNEILYFYRTTENSLSNNKYYYNMSELVSTAIISRKKLYENLDLFNDHEELFINKAIEYKFSEIANLYRLKANLSEKERKEKLNTILKDKLFQEYMKKYNPKDKISKLYCIIIKFKNINLINLIFKFIFILKYRFKKIYYFIRKSKAF